MNKCNQCKHHHETKMQNNMFKHKCACYPSVILFGDLAINDTIVENCGMFEELREYKGGRK